MSEIIRQYWTSHPTEFDNTGKPRPCQVAEVLDARPLPIATHQQTVNFAPGQPMVVHHHHAVEREQPPVMYVPRHGAGIWKVFSLLFAGFGLFAVFQTSVLNGKVAELQQQIAVRNAQIEAMKEMGAILR